jgi:hypothetical protein
MNQNVPFFFHEDGGRMQPSELCRSPWSKDAINGVALGALLAHGFEEPLRTGTMQLSRLTIDILGPVPRGPLELRVEAVRSGRQFALWQAELIDQSGRAGARAHAQFVRSTITPKLSEPLIWPMPEELDESLRSMPKGFFGGAAQVKPVRGGVTKSGPGTLWAKTNVEVIAGTPLTPLTRAAIISDWGNGLGSVLPRGEYTFANLDIGINFLRMPESEWLLIDSHTLSAGNGHGLVRNIFGDRHGIYAHGYQTIFVGKISGN